METFEDGAVPTAEAGPARPEKVRSAMASSTG